MNYYLRNLFFVLTLSILSNNVLKAQQVLNEKIFVFQVQPEEKKFIEPSTVFISQIGDYNTTSIKISEARSGNIKVSQQGFSNSVYKNKNAEFVSENVLQQGNFNKVHDVSSAYSLKAETKFSQQGNNLLIEKYGSNSISENMGIHMTGNYRSIRVHSF